MSTRFVVWDTYTQRVERSRSGHFTVYSNRKAAHRRAGNLNRSVAPPIKRWEPRPVSVALLS